MAQKPSIPKGTRDFSPIEVAKRNYIIDTIKKQFRLFGFQAIETPSFENSDTLMGKYGEEGDRLIFKILESGEYFEKAKSKITNPLENNTTVTYLSELITSVLKNIRTELKSECLDNFSGSAKYINMQKISAYISDNIGSILNSAPQIAYVGQFERRIFYYFKDNAIRISSDIVNRGSFFDNDIAFENFILNEQKDILEDLVKTLMDFYVLNIKSNKLTQFISEKALRYDLTVPFARYVVQHQNEIDFPFKRYQIQPVWRADRPQKGRFREFYQCDADVVGSTSLWQEVDFIQLYDKVFTELNLSGVTIKINNRKILSGIAEVIGAKDKLIDFTVALDKLDKIGEDGVKKEMLTKGISEDAIEKVKPLFSFTGTAQEKIDELKILLASSDEGQQGVEELQFIINAIANIPLKTATLDLDVTLARGLNYYTGAIFEVTAPETVKMGSIGGGGRYDDLTGIFGLKDVSGVGISFGLDRIYLVLEELSLFPETVLSSTKAMFINFGEAEALYCLKAVNLLRDEGVVTELYPDNAKMKKQMGYANKRQIPFVILAGETEMNTNTFMVKNMQSGTQEEMDFEKLKVLF